MSASTKVAGRNILVAEDDPSMREAIQRLLCAAGFESAGFLSAEALLAAGAAAHADCFVSDLKLPGMSGLELLAELRARGIRAPLILVTAYHTPGLREEAERCGAAAYLIKPFRGTELLETVKAAIEQAEASCC